MISGEVFAIIDGSPQLIGRAIAVDFGAICGATAIHAFSGITLQPKLSAKSARVFAALFSPDPKLMLLRRQAIAKARGRNWRACRLLHRTPR